MYGSEAGSASLCVLKAILVFKLICRAEIDNRPLPVSFKAGDKIAPSETKVTAAVNPGSVRKHHPFFTVTETECPCQWVNGVHGEDSTTFFWLSRALLIRRGRRLSSRHLLGSESDEHDQRDEEKAFHDLSFLTVKIQIHILPFVFLGLVGETCFSCNYRLATFGSGTSS